MAREIKKYKVLIIVPAYNEEAVILDTYKSICSYKSTKNIQIDCLIVNDGSTDNTEKICTLNDIPHLNLKNNLGIGGAVQAGYKYAKKHNYDIAIQFDGDGQHEVNCLKDIIKPLLNNNADMVIGSRFIKKESSKFQSSQARRAGIKLISLMIKLSTGKKIHDTTSGFRAVNKDIISIFTKQYPSEYPEPVSVVTLSKKNKRIIEIPVSMNERKGGESSIKYLKTFYFMINVILYIIIESLGGYKYEY